MGIFAVFSALHGLSGRALIAKAISHGTTVQRRAMFILEDTNKRLKSHSRRWPLSDKYRTFGDVWIREIRL
jgi:hypothetical protein